MWFCEEHVHTYTYSKSQCNRDALLGTNLSPYHTTPDLQEQQCSAFMKVQLHDLTLVWNVLILIVAAIVTYG